MLDRKRCFIDARRRLFTAARCPAVLLKTGEPALSHWLSTTSYYGFLPDGELWTSDDGLRPALRARLRSLQSRVQEAVSRRDYAGALRLAYRTLEALADELRPAWANALPSDQVLVQALLVEVERRPIVAMEDTTLRELQGIAVWVSHRAWATTRKEALEIARRLVAWSGGPPTPAPRPTSSSSNGGP